MVNKETIKINISDLLLIKDTATAMKQRNLLLLGNRLYGTEMMSVSNPLRINEVRKPFLFNAKELSAFVKTLTIETEIEFSNIMSSQWIASSRANGSIEFIYEPFLASNIMNTLNTVAQYPYIDCGDITNDLSNLFELKKTDSTIKYIHELNGCKYLMFLFSGIIPLLKNDKIYLGICDHGYLFTTRFIVQKKKGLTVTSYFRFRKI